ERLLMQLLEHAPHPREEWLVIFLEEGPMVRRAADMGVVTAVVRSGRLREAPRFPAAVGAIAGLARRHRADVLFGWMPKAQLYAGPAAVLAKLPALWYQHGTPRASSWSDRVPALLPCRGVLACSGDSAEAQARLAPNRPTRVVYP